MGFPIFAITNGTDRIDLLDKFLTIVDFRSSILEPQGDVWGSSPFADGRMPISMQLGNLIIEATLSAKGCDEDDLAYKSQKVRQLLENARQYWLSPSWKIPVWVEMRGSNESNMRYAYIYDYRATGTGNPFAAPTFDYGNALLIFPLVLETTPWQDKPLGLSNCIEISNLQPYYSVSVSNNFSVIHDQDDCYVDWPEKTINIGDDYGMAGARNPGYYTDAYMTWRNITIPRGSIITAAHISLKANNNYNAATVNLRIRGVRKVNPDIWNIYLAQSSDSSRSGNPTPDTTAYVDWSAVGAWTNGTWYDTPSLVSIIQEIINLPTWVSGDGIAIHIDDNGSTANAYRVFHAMPYSGGGDVEKLYITYLSVGNVGSPATCAKEIAISNKHNKAQITNIFRYTAAGGVWEDLMALGWPQALFPVAPAIGDCFYVGIAQATPGSGPFRSMVFDLIASAADIAFTMSYSLAAGWGNVGAHGWADNTDILKAIGVSTFHFEPQLDFDHQVVNGVDGWWIKYEITGLGGSPASPVQANRQIYTIVTPYFDIDAAQLKGELPVMARTLLYNRGFSVVPSLDIAYAKKLFLATRRLSRGVDFTPYLNASDWQQPAGLTYTVLGAPAETSMVEDVAVTAGPPIYGSPTGKMTFFSHAGATHSPLAVRAYWEFAYNMGKQYAGRYAAYIRCNTYKSFPSFATNFQVALQIQYGLTVGSFTTYQTKTVSLGTDPLSTYIDTFSLMEDLMDDEYLANFHINLMIGAPDDVVYADLYIFDVILVPIDEFVLVAETDTTILAIGAPPYYYGVYVDVDSIGNPKNLRTTARVETSNDYIANLNRLSRSPWMLNPRTTQRVWYFSPGSLNISYLAQQYGVFRYYDLRGKD